MSTNPKKKTKLALQKKKNTISEKKKEKESSVKFPSFVKISEYKLIFLYFLFFFSIRGFTDSVIQSWRNCKSLISIVLIESSDLQKLSGYEIEFVFISIWVYA